MMNTITDYEQNWESYLSRVDSVTLRQQLRVHTKDILHMLSKFDSNFPPTIDVGPGWIHIIAKLHNAIFFMNPNYKLAQVKQKFGGLRYYVDLHFDDDQDPTLPTEIINVLIRHAEELASQTCEECGEPGKLNKSKPWIKTVCDNCV